MPQDKLFLDFEPVIPINSEDYPERAQAAAIRRARRVGSYTLSKRVKGFSTSVKNLWIPYSAGENTIVTSVPEPKIVRDKYNARKRIIEKFKDEDIDSKKINAWANFSAYNTEIIARSKFMNFQFDALQQMTNLGTALSEEERRYSRESILENEIALDALSWYLVNLKSFSGVDDNGHVTTSRKWVQKNWTKILRVEKDKAINFINEQNNESLYNLYEESYFNNWCRNKFWAEVQNEHKNYLRKNRNIEPEYIEVPIEVYESDIDLFDSE
jgi:hypothetical protein